MKISNDGSVSTEVKGRGHDGSDHLEILYPVSWTSFDTNAELYLASSPGSTYPFSACNIEKLGVAWG